MGTFFTQISMAVSKIAFTAFALFFAYHVWKQIFISVDLFTALGFIFLFLFCLLLVLLSAAVVGAIVALLGCLFKKGVLGEHEFEFRDDEFVEKTDFNESTHKYRSINKVFMRRGSIYIGLPVAEWHILPERDFASSKDRDNLFTWLKKAGRLAGKLSP